jgi:AcrR family transcriptional regulator
LLDAAWDELAAVGYANLTMESVAVRARTGVAVLYRRWANKDMLVLAAVEHYRSTHPVELPDTGTLRGDLIAMLDGMGRARANFFAVAVASALTGLLADTGLTLAQIREKVLGDAALTRTDAIYQRAHDRGEIDLDTVPAAVLALPFDLVRHDLFMNLKPVGRERLESIVDDLFLPLAVGSVRSGPR